MINKISVDTTSRIYSQNARKNKDSNQQEPSFKGAGSFLLQGIQYCERMPMVNVAIIDLLSAILPRTFVESRTNWFAGFEAFRRESSGLVVNCLIPSFIALGFAKLLNGNIMPKGVNLSECWADSSLINEAKEYYNNAKSSDKIKEALKGILGDIEGYDGKNKVVFKDTKNLSAEELDKYAEKLAKIAGSNKKDKQVEKEVKSISDELIKKLHVSENIKISGIKNEVKASSVNGMLVDSVKFYKGFQEVAGTTTIEEFAKRSKNLVKAKSALGLAVVIPLAISMQYINRWITGKVSGVKGAPIYDDFAKGENIENNNSKEGLLKQKIISISSMLGVSLLSMMKKPTLGMLEFKGMFPTMDQARIISTATFSSRMAAADDKNELAESTVRDIATFSGLYFLGDYADKATATLIEKNRGIKLLNDSKPISKDANALQKFWHWVKDVRVKSSDEVVSKTQEMLKAQGAEPTAEQLKTIEKELKQAINWRSTCQAASIGVSLILLGILVPIYTRRNTKKKHEQALKLAQQNAKTQIDEKEQPETVTPLNVKYSKLTAGFRAEKH